MNNPQKSEVIQGIVRLRKIRVASHNRGKHGGSRVIYYYLHPRNSFYLLTIYAKNELANLTNEQKKQLKTFVEAWKNEQT